MDEIKIEKGIPIPPRTGNTGSKFAHLVRQLEVGDSFWIPKSNVGKGFPGGVRNLAAFIKIRITIRTEKKDDVIGWRVWRIERQNGLPEQAKGANQ